MEAASPRIVQPAMPRPGTQSATADAPTKPVAVPTAHRIGMPSVKCTAAKALRMQINHTAARSVAAARPIPVENRGPMIA